MCGDGEDGEVGPDLLGLVPSYWNPSVCWAGRAMEAGTARQEKTMSNNLSMPMLTHVISHLA